MEKNTKEIGQYKSQKYLFHIFLKNANEKIRKKTK